MDTLIRYSNKLMLAMGAVMCFAGAGLCTPYVETILNIAGFAFAVWSIIEPAREEADDED